MARICLEKKTLFKEYTRMRRIICAVLCASIYMQSVEAAPNANQAAGKMPETAAPELCRLQCPGVVFAKPYISLNLFIFL